MLQMVLIFTLVKFSQPTYGDYTYPPWAVGLGWFIAVISLIPIPLLAVVKLIGSKGPISQVSLSISKLLQRPGRQRKFFDTIYLLHSLIISISFKVDFHCFFLTENIRLVQTRSQLPTARRYKFRKRNLDANNGARRK